MESLQEGIRRASIHPKKAGPTSRPRPPVASEFMSTDLLILRPEQTMTEAMALLDKRRVSGAPVLGEGGRVLGILSELDCMKMVASCAYHQEGVAGQTRVVDLMSTEVLSIEPSTDLYAICHHFMTARVRRLPVVSNDQLVGIVSRRDVLRVLRKTLA